MRYFLTFVVFVTSLFETRFLSELDLKWKLLYCESQDQALISILWEFKLIHVMVIPLQDNFNWGINNLKVHTLDIEIKRLNLTISTQKFWTLLSLCLMLDSYLIDR